MKILSSNGNYTNGTQIVELDSGIIEKRFLFVVNGLPTYSVQETWFSVEDYLASIKSSKIDFDKVFKNW